MSHFLADFLPKNWQFFDKTIETLMKNTASYLSVEISTVTDAKGIIEKYDSEQQL